MSERYAGMTVDEFTHRRETEAQKFAEVRGRTRSWTGTFYVAPEDRADADAIVRAGLRVTAVTSGHCDVLEHFASTDEQADEGGGGR